MLPINAQSPLRRRMAQQCVAILLQVRRQLDARRYWISGGCASGDNIAAAVKSATVNASPTRYERPCRSCSIRSSAAATVARSASSFASLILCRKR
jgi:hypothetical protein